MQVALKTTFITVEEYLARERAAEYKSEYFNGEIFAMAGGSKPHNLIASKYHRRASRPTEASLLQRLPQ
jgi:Uma2 family endonuclease